MVSALELGIELETVFLRPSPLNPDPELSVSNPLSKIPALVLDDGTALYDSPVICEYLDGLAGGGRLLPASGSARWRVLRLQALADGIVDAGVMVFYESTLRPEALRWEAWLEGQRAKLRQGLDVLEGEAASFAGVDLGQISAAAAIGWLEFRGCFGDVRAGRPALTRWYEAFSQRPSMVATIPHM
jgi:glutathione S-transferase